MIIYKDFVFQSHIIGINPGIIAETIAIRKNYKLKIADAIIAATALAFDITLVADNDDDFEKVPSLKYINPRKL
jgi:predicted nucleic acid-binding protein